MLFLAPDVAFYFSGKKKDEDFYSSLPPAEDEISDISEADADEMAKTLAVSTTFKFDP